MNYWPIANNIYRQKSSPKFRIFKFLRRTKDWFSHATTGFTWTTDGGPGPPRWPRTITDDGVRYAVKVIVLKLSPTSDGQHASENGTHLIVRSVSEWVPCCFKFCLLVKKKQRVLVLYECDLLLLHSRLRTLAHELRFDSLSFHLPFTFCLTSKTSYFPSLSSTFFQPKHASSPLLSLLSLPFPFIHFLLACRTPTPHANQVLPRPI